MRQPDPVLLDEDVQARAEAMAAEDRKLLDMLKEQTAEWREKNRPTPEPEPVVHLNRAERRTQVKMYAQLLAETEKQTPVRNATIIPRAARRRRKAHRAH